MSDTRKRDCLVDINVDVVNNLLSKVSGVVDHEERLKFGLHKLKNQLKFNAVIDVACLIGEVFLFLYLINSVDIRLLHFLDKRIYLCVIVVSVLIVGVFTFGLFYTLKDLMRILSKISVCRRGQWVVAYGLGTYYRHMKDVCSDLCNIISDDGVELGGELVTEVMSDKFLIFESLSIEGTNYKTELVTAFVCNDYTSYWSEKNGICTYDLSDRFQYELRMLSEKVGPMLDEIEEMLDNAI